MPPHLPYCSAKCGSSLLTHPLPSWPVQCTTRSQSIAFSFPSPHQLRHCPALRLSPLPAHLLSPWSLQPSHCPAQSPPLSHYPTAAPTVAFIRLPLLCISSRQALVVLQLRCFIGLHAAPACSWGQPSASMALFAFVWGSFRRQSCARTPDPGNILVHQYILRLHLGLPLALPLAWRSHFNPEAVAE